MIGGVGRRGPACPDRPGFHRRRPWGDGGRGGTRPQLGHCPRPNLLPRTANFRPFSNPPSPPLQRIRTAPPHQRGALRL